MSSSVFSIPAASGELPQLSRETEAEESHAGTNIDVIERVISALVGASMLYGMAQHTWLGSLIATAGGLLIIRALRGYCPVYAAVETRSVHDETCHESLSGDKSVDDRDGEHSDIQTRNEYRRRPREMEERRREGRLASEEEYPGRRPAPDRPGKRSEPGRSSHDLTNHDLRTRRRSPRQSTSQESDFC